MMELIRRTNVMVVEFEVFGELEYRFEKYASKDAGMVRVFVNGEEINVFTNYEIGDNLDRFQDACEEYLREQYTEE
jgi:hypothetical protein